jgi:hypothetical protein
MRSVAHHGSLSLLHVMRMMLWSFMRNFHNVMTALIVKPLSVLVNSKKWNIKVQISVTRHESVRHDSGGVRQNKQTQRKLFLGLLGFSINFHWIFV